jgi:integrase
VVLLVSVIDKICDLGAAHYGETRSAAAVGSLIKHIRKLKSLDTREITLWRDKLSDRYTPNTVRRILGILRAMLDRGVEYGIIDKAPKIRLPSAPRGRVVWLTDEQETELLASLAGQSRDLTVFLIDTGMRVGEALSWGGKITDSPKGPMITLEKTKTDRARTIPLTQRAEGVARRYRRGFRITYRQFYKQWQRARKNLGQLGNKDWVIHMLRHTFASRLAQRGAPIAVISQLLGHQNLEQTMVYSHLSLDCLQQSIDLIRGDNAKGPRDS